MQVMFCVPCGTSQHEPSDSHSVATSPIVIHSPTKQSQQQDSNSTTNNNDPTTSTAYTTPSRKYTRTGSFMLPAGPGFPHRKTSTVISIAAAKESHRFVAADDEGTISLWYFYKHNAITDNIENLKTPRKPQQQHHNNSSNTTQRHGTEKLMIQKPILKGVLSLSSIDISGNYPNERVIEMNFLHDENQLIVSTNKRLLLLQLGQPKSTTQNIEDTTTNTPKQAQRRTSMFTSPLAPNPVLSNPQTPIIEKEEDDLAFIGWVELDRAIPGKVGLFAMHMSLAYVPLYPGASTATAQRTITQWRITEEDQAVASRFQLITKKKATDGKHKCTVYRFEWTESMFSAALDQMKYF